MKPVNRKCSAPSRSINNITTVNFTWDQTSRTFIWGLKAATVPSRFGSLWAPSSLSHSFFCSRCCSRSCSCPHSVFSRGCGYFYYNTGNGCLESSHDNILLRCTAGVVFYCYSILLTHKLQFFWWRLAFQGFCWWRQGWPKICPSSRITTSI